MLTAGIQADGSDATPPVEWPVEVRTAGRSALLVDVGADALDHASLDRLELKAEHVWSNLTRSAGLFEPRPWIGALRVSEADVADADVMKRVRRLVTSRTLDAACVVVLDRAGRAVRSPSPVLSLESFAASLTGRCLVLAAANSAKAR